MALSASTDWSQTASDLISDAYMLTGITPEEEPLTSAQLATGLRFINAMFKTWQKRGVAWKRAEGSITAVAGQQSYTLGPAGDFTTRPVRLTRVWFRSSASVDMPMREMSSEEYDNLAYKSTAGTPMNYYYSPLLTQAKLYVWPVLASGVTGTIRFTYAGGLDDFDAASNDPAIPQDYMEAVKYALALRLNDLPGGVMSADAKARAIAYEAQLLADSMESGSIYFQPEYG